MSPVDQGQFVGTGWSFPIAATHSGGIAMASGHEDIDQAIFLILSTSPGERPMRPEFGCGLSEYVFAPADVATAARVSAVVHSALRRWEPRIRLDRVEAVPDYRLDETVAFLRIEIDYTVLTTYDRRNLVVPFYVIPRSE